MTRFKRLIVSVVILTVLLAVSMPAYSIGFKAEETYNSVFVVTSGNALGSGFAIGENCIVTNAHVIDDRDDITIHTYSGERYSVGVIGMDEDRDIAILVLKDGKLPYIKVADLSEMNTGDDVYAIGAPKSMAYTLTKGVISAKERTVGRYSYIQTDAAINEGNSGGPLLNDAGQVVGVNTMKMTDSEGIGLAIPINVVCEYIKSFGIEVDTNGNVVGSYEGDAPLPDAADDTQPDSEPDTKRSTAWPDKGKVILILVVLLTCSVVGNIVLIVVLATRRKKNAPVPIDPSERTDFEIDILE